MYWVSLAIALIVSYLAGSLNFALLITTFVKKIDIRKLGTGNPGTANIGRNIGRGWGALVFLGDVAKAILPLMIAERVCFPLTSIQGTGGLVLMGMAVILGHRKPLYFGFRGGGGLATTMGELAFFVPLELGISMLAGFLLGMLLFRNKEQKLGRWVAMLIILMTVPVAVVLSLLVDVPIAGRVSLGGLEWFRVLGVGILVLYIVASNGKTVLTTIRGSNGPEIPGPASGERDRC